MKTSSDFRLIESAGYGYEFQPLGRWRKEFTDYINTERITAVGLFDTALWRDDDIAFLLDVHCLRSLRIHCNRRIDVSALEALSMLEELRLELGFSSRKEIDLATLARLKRLDFTHDRKLKGWEHLVQLSHLTISYLRGVRSLSFEKFGSLGYLEVANGRSLEEITVPNHAPLKCLGLHYLPSLSVVRGDGEWEKDVEILRLTAAKQLDAGFIERFIGLRWLYLEKMGNLGTLRFPRRPKDVWIMEGVKAEILPAKDGG